VGSRDVKRGGAIVLLLGMAVISVGNSPLAPLAEGPFDSIALAVKAARKCGIEELRLEVRAASTRMFYAGDPKPNAGNVSLLCLARWQRANAERLSLSKRWFQYDYGPRR
jgi:hypothetical protein